MPFGTGKLWFDGKMVDWEQATVSVMTHALHYGSSVFEGLRCYALPDGSAVFRLGDHIERLFDSAKVYRMEPGFSRETLTAAVLETVKINDLASCYIRPLLFRGAGAMGLNPLPCPVHAVVAAWEWGKYLGDAAMEQGVSVRISSWRRAAPDTFPALAKAGGNYLSSQLIKLEALQDGYDEGIALDYAGFVSEGSGENVFVVRHGEIFTPPSSASILPGLTRHCVIMLARELGLTVRRQMIPREALTIADEVFFSGTAAEITPVTRIDGALIGSGRRGPVTERIQSAFFDIVEGRTPDRFGWFTPVA